jgi:hypothetical protein
MKKIFILFLIILIPTFIIRLNASKESNLTIYNQCDFFLVDNLNNIYTINNNKVSKIDSTGKVIGIFDSKSYGRIGWLDISNPLKIMIFYSETNKVQFLDRSLAPLENPIDLFSIFNENFSLACVSYSNGLWLYNMASASLLRVDNQINITSKIENLSTQFDTIFAPNLLIEIEDKLLMSDPNNGIIIFDRWGAIIKRIPIKLNGRFNMANNIIFYHRSDTLYGYSQLSFEEKPLFVADCHIKNTFVTKTDFYIQSIQDTIFRFSIQ